MKIRFAILIFVFCGFTAGNAYCLSEDRIEFDLVNKIIRIADFLIGEYKLSGFFTFNLDRDNGSLIFDLEGKDIFLTTLEGKSLARYKSINFPWLKASLVKRGNIIFIERFALPQLAMTGNINLNKGELALSINGQWQESSQLLEGNIKITLGVWGKIGKFFTSGQLVAKDGKYKGRKFSKFRIDFLGNPPVFSITDSEVVSLDGSVFEVEGTLDLRDFSNLIPGAKFTAQKVVIDQWQLFSGNDSDIGLRTDIDDKFGISINTDEREDETTSTETELRYNLKDDRFLKFKVDEDRTLLQFERRKDF
jgi:hypothetical protein